MARAGDAGDLGVTPPGYHTARVWGWLTAPLQSGRHRVKVLGPATAVVVLALGHHQDTLLARGFPPGSTAADLGLLTGLTPAHVGRLLLPLTHWDVPLVRRERGRTGEWLYRLTPPGSPRPGFHPPTVD